MCGLIKFSWSLLRMEKLSHLNSTSAKRQVCTAGGLGLWCAKLLSTSNYTQHKSWAKTWKQILKILIKENLLKGRKHLMRKTKEMFPQGIVPSPSASESISHTENCYWKPWSHPSLSGKLEDGIKPRVVLLHSQGYFHHQRSREIFWWTLTWEQGVFHQPYSVGKPRNSKSSQNQPKKEKKKGKTTPCIDIFLLKRLINITHCVNIWRSKQSFSLVEALNGGFWAAFYA